MYKLQFHFIWLRVDEQTSAWLEALTVLETGDKLQIGYKSIMRTNQWVSGEVGSEQVAWGLILSLRKKNLHQEETGQHGGDETNDDGSERHVVDLLLTHTLHLDR